MQRNNDLLHLILDINNVRFSKKTLKAYDMSEVDQFFDELINVLEENTDYSYALKK